MGCFQSKNKGLSPQIREKALKIFQSIDIDGSKTIDKEETKKFWKTNFGKINTEELFKAVDFDNSGKITEEEWMAFWEIVKKSGHSDKEINDELDELSSGKAWVKFSGVDQFIKKDKQNKRGSVLKEIVGQEKIRLQQEEQQKTPLSVQNQKKHLEVDQQSKQNENQDQEKIQQ